MLACIFESFKFGVFLFCEFLNFATVFKSFESHHGRTVSNVSTVFATCNSSRDNQKSVEAVFSEMEAAKIFQRLSRT